MNITNNKNKKPRTSLVCQHVLVNEVNSTFQSQVLAERGWLEVLIYSDSAGQGKVRRGEAGQGEARVWLGVRWGWEGSKAFTTTTTFRYTHSLHCLLPHRKYYYCYTLDTSLKCITVYYLS